MKKQWALIVSAAVLIGVSLPSSNAAQKRGRPAAASRKTELQELGNVDLFKEAFQNDAGKIRLVALVSPT